MSQVVKKKSFFIKYYLVIIMLAMFILTFLSHLLVLHVASFLKYIPIVGLIISMALIVNIYTKKREAKTFLKKFLNYIAAILIAFFLVSGVERFAQRTVIEIQKKYSEKLDKEWKAKIDSETFLNEMQEYMDTPNEDITSASETKLIELVLKYQEEIFLPAFNDRNKLLHIFMIPNDFK